MKKIYFYIIVVSFSFPACETIVDIDIPYESPELVLNSTLVPDSLLRVHLSQSQHILDQSTFKPVERALVNVYEDGVLLTTLPDSTNGYYISDSFAPQKGRTYKITASRNGFIDVDAEVTIPQDTAKILSVKSDTVTLSEFGYTASYIRFGVSIEDDVQVDNYYEISVVMEYYVNIYDYNFDPPLVIDSILLSQNVYLESRDPSLEEYQSYGNKIIFDDKLFNGNVYTMSVLVQEYNFENRDTDFTLYILLKNTSESYHKYQLTTQLQYWVDGDPFAQPVQVYNNINNGYGILDAYNQVRFEVK